MGKKSRNGGPSTPVARRTPTPIQTEPGKALPTTAPELRLAGNGAFGSGRFAEAAHMYTLAIDLLSRGMPRDADGVASAADLFARNRAGGGELCTLLLNRSCVQLKLGERARRRARGKPALDERRAALPPPEADEAPAAAAAAGGASPLEATRRVADDPDDPRRFIAAADYGAALAVGAFGAARDPDAAERYLRLAAPEDLSARRNLGLLLAERGRAD